jgi:hypothetical protein
MICKQTLMERGFSLVPATTDLLEFHIPDGEILWHPANGFSINEGDNCIALRAVVTLAQVDALLKGLKYVA